MEPGDRAYSARMMNRLLIALFKLDHARRAGVVPADRPTRAVLWVDQKLAAAYEEPDCARAFEGTRDWVTLERYRVGLPTAAVLPRYPGVAHLVLSDAPIADAMGPEVVFSSQLPPKGTLEYSLCIEAAHHDHELQGFNHWLPDGRVAFSQHVLWHLSAAQCRSHFPQYVLPELEQMRAKSSGPVHAMDIGCGLLSRLRWGQVRGLLSVTGVDPLLNIYRAIIARHGLAAVPGISPDDCVSTRAEEMPLGALAGRFGLVFVSNALDHTQEPERVVSNITELLLPEGLVIIQGAVNEGTREGWNQLHKFDFRVEGDALACYRMTGAKSTLIGPEAPLRMHRIHFLSEELLCVVAKRKGS